MHVTKIYAGPAWARADLGTFEEPRGDEMSLFCVVCQDVRVLVTRWKMKIAEYDFDVVYKAGKTNVNADASSRNPIDLEDIENDICNKNII